MPPAVHLNILQKLESGPRFVTEKEGSTTSASASLPVKLAVNLTSHTD